MKSPVKPHHQQRVGKGSAEALPTPPKSSSGTLSRRSSPRSGPLTDASGPSVRSGLGSPRLDGLLKAKSVTAASPSQKKRKTTSAVPFSEDLLCPICDDVCTCVGAGDATSGPITWPSSNTCSTAASPIVIKDSKKGRRKQQTQSAAQRRKKAEKAVLEKKAAWERRIDLKADTMAQLVLSEYYFDQHDDLDEESGDTFDESLDEDVDSGLCELSDDLDSTSSLFDDSDAELDAIIFQLSEDSSSEDEETTRRMKELLLTKVNRVLGPNAAFIMSSDDDSEGEEEAAAAHRWHLFDPAAPVNLPPPPPPTPVDADAHLSNLTPQVLAAISMANKTLTAATQHYTATPNVPFIRGAGAAKSQVAFVFEQQAEPRSLTNVSLEELIDTSCLHGSSPPVTTGPLGPPMQLRRWDRIPISSFRKRRLSVPRNLMPLPANAIKQPPPEEMLMEQHRLAHMHLDDDVHSSKRSPEVLPKPLHVLIFPKGPEVLIHADKGTVHRHPHIQLPARIHPGGHGGSSFPWCIQGWVGSVGVHGSVHDDKDVVVEVHVSEAVLFHKHLLRRRLFDGVGWEGHQIPRDT